MRKHRNSYQEKLREQVGRWQAGIDRLKEHLKQAGNGSRQQVEHQVRDLQAKQKAAHRKLEKLERRDDSANAVDRSAPKPVKTAIHGVRSAYRRIVTGFK